MLSDLPIERADSTRYREARIHLQGPYELVQCTS